MSSEREAQVLAWVAWLTSAAILTMILRNPLYSLLLLLVTRVVLTFSGKRESVQPFAFWRFGAIIIAVSALYSALFVHIGETVLLRVPAISVIGGPITLEAVTFGASNGLLLVTLISCFAVFYAAVPAHDLVRLLPGSFLDLGLVLQIAMTYVPETTRQLRRIREAQAIRGHRLNGLRGWRPVVIPLLVGGLERAVGLSELMVARGYGSTSDARLTAAIRLRVVIGLFAVLLGWLLSIWRGWPFFLVTVFGAGLLVATAVGLGRGASRTRYKARKWRGHDTLMVVASAIPLALFLLPVSSAGVTAFYSPYPELTWPPFHVVGGLGLMLLTYPAFLGDE